MAASRQRSQAEVSWPFRTRWSLITFTLTNQRPAASPKWPYSAESDVPLRQLRQASPAVVNDARGTSLELNSIWQTDFSTESIWASLNRHSFHFASQYSQTQ